MSIQLYDREKDLLSGVARGDKAAFALLYEQYRRKVWFIAHRLLGSESGAEDVQQEIFTRIWMNRQKLTEIENFSSYLNTLIRNYVYNALRKKAVETTYLREILHIAEPDDAFRSSEINELQRLLTQAIRELPKQQQAVFQLVRMEGRRHDEVAEMLGISKETVKKHIMEAQRKVKAFFEGKGKTALLLLVLLTQY